MGNNYTEDAYQLVYKHPEWQDTAQKYEDEFAANLYKSSYVKEAARTVLHRLSSMLMAYYGLKDRQKEEDVENRDMLGEIAYTIMGTVPNELVDQKQIFQGREVLEDTLLSSWSGAGQIGDARKSNPSQVAGEYESVGGSRDALTGKSADKAFEEMSSFINQQNIFDVMEVDGNLREMMTMLYNGMIINGGRTKEEIAKSRSLKNMLLNINEADITQMNEIGQKIRTLGYENPDALPQGFMYGEDQLMNASVDFKSLKGMSSYKNKTDLFDSAGMVEDLPKMKQKKKKQGNALSRWFSGKLRMLKAGIPRFMLVTKKKGDEIQGLGRDHYLNLGIAPSVREDIHAHRKGQWGWKEGTSFYKRKMSAKGMVRIAGPSGTTIRMMGAYKLLGASKQELLNFRLALIGWMGTSRDHSLVEILQGSHYAGVVGKENLTEAATMYQTVDPLNAKEIREQYAPNHVFPHEIIFRKMLNEVREARRSRMNPEMLKKQEHMNKGSLFQWNKEENLEGDYDAQKFDAGDLAINIYTTQSYETINISKYSMDLAKHFFMKKATTKKEREDSKLRDQIYDTLRVSARIAEDTMLERALEESKIAQVENKFDLDDSVPDIDAKLAEYENSKQAYRGITYRGGRIFGSMKSGVFEPKNLTSSSESLIEALQFYQQADVPYNKKAILNLHLTGKNAVNINHLSQFEYEQEVLIPPKSVFTIDKFEEKVYIWADEDAYTWQIYRENEINDEMLQEMEQEEIAFKNDPKKTKRHWHKCQMITLTEVGGPGIEARVKANKRKEKRQKSMQQLMDRGNF